MTTKTARTPKEYLCDVLPDEYADAIIAHRKGLKAPLTGIGAKALAIQYMLTGDPVAAAEHHLNVGWRGFKADWMNKGNRFSDNNNPMPKRGGAPVSFDGPPMSPDIARRIVLPATHFSKMWKGREQ